jgi:hypothetical protein
MAGTLSPSEAGGRASRALRWTGLLFGCGYGAMAWLFAAGETATDPGGSAAVGLVALWTVPLAALALLAWYRPGRAARLLAFLTGAVVVVGAWFALAPGSWRSFEHGHGPLRALALLVLLVPLALLGWRSPAPAGLMLLVIGIAPLLAASAASGAGGRSSLLAVALPAALDGLLYLLAAAFARPRPSVRASGDAMGGRTLAPDRGRSGAARRARLDCVSAARGPGGEAVSIAADTLGART